MKNIAVIGAGVAGISAAIGCALRGHRVCIFEQGITPGGMTTAWDRKSYHFEGCIHWVVGSTPTMRSLHENWKMLGALRDNNPLTFKDPVYVYKSSDGELNLWRDTCRLEREMTAYAPEDAAAIRRFCSDIRLAEAFFLRCGGLQGEGEEICPCRGFYCASAAFDEAFFRRILHNVLQCASATLRRFHF